MRQGVGLGYELGYKHYLIKTFVTYDMARGRQKKIFEATRDDFSRKLTDKPQPIQRFDQPSFLLSEEEIKNAIRKIGKI